MKQLLMPLLLVISLMTGCDQQENFPVAARSGGAGNSHTRNTLTFVPTDWTFEVNNGGHQHNPNNYQSLLQVSSASTRLALPVSATGLAGVTSRATSYSLGMAATTIHDTTSFCYWYSQLVPPATLRIGDSLTLKARIRVNQVQGQGITLLIRDDKSTLTAALCRKREGQISVTGTADFVSYTYTLPYTNPVRYFRVYLLMPPQTIGTATFSDMSVQVN